MSTIVLPNSISGLGWRFRPIRLGRFLSSSPRNLREAIITFLFRRQLKSLGKMVSDLKEFNELVLELEYVEAAPLLPKVSKLQKRLQRATMRMMKDKEKIIDEVPNAPVYFERLEQVMLLMDQLLESLTFMEYLTHDAKFLLRLPDDTRYKVMAFAMDRVRAEMEKDPMGKAEYEAEQEAWLNADFGPVLEYGD